MIEYSTFQETYKKINKSDDKNFFDMLLIPFVSALNYQMKGISSSVGSMIIEHNNKLIVARPDNDSKIIFTFSDVKYKYENRTIIFSLDIPNKKINIMMPYFGEYKTIIPINFFDDQDKYNAISILDFNVLNSTDKVTRQKMFYKLIIKYDIQHRKKLSSKLLLFEINKLLQNADIDLINLIVAKVYDQSGYNKSKLTKHFDNLLKEQNNDNKYELINTLDQKSASPTSQTQKNEDNSFASIANSIMNNKKEKETGDRRVNVAKSFKQ